MKLAGIDDKPTYQRNQLINKTEETQNIIMQASYLDEEYVREKLLAINGDIDQLDEITKRIDAEGFKRNPAADQDEEEAEEQEEAGE